MDEKLRKQAELEFTRARIQLLQKKPFWAHLVMKLELKWMDEVAGGLSCTDGKSIMIQPDTFCKLKPDERVACLVHEAAHCAWGHLSRVGGRDMYRFNLAGDIQIDNMLATDGFAIGPYEHNRAVGVEKLTGHPIEYYRGMGAEKTYDLLPIPPKGGGCGGCGGKDSDGNCFKPATGEQAASQEAEWRRHVVEAASAAKQAGATPGAWSELVEAAMPHPPFHIKLFEFLSRGMGGDSTWNSLNRRWLWQGMYLPTEQREVMGESVAIVDTSGSMSKEAIAEAIGYHRSFRESHPHKLHFIECDYDCARDEQYRAYEEFEPLPAKVEVHGRGGTSFDAPFKLLREKRIEPKLIVYYTDGYGAVSKEVDPHCPVLWVIVKEGGMREGFKPPFGEVCYAVNKTY